MRQKGKIKKVVFVCTGNTCRSPMAEAIFNQKAQKLGLLWKAFSCGVAAFDGSPASDNAKKAALEFGGDLSGHISKTAHRDFLNDADMILTMSKRHYDIILTYFPELKDKLSVFAESEIEDPFGGNFEVYMKTAKQIEKAADKLLEKLVSQPDEDDGDV